MFFAKVKKAPYFCTNKQKQHKVKTLPTPQTTVLNALKMNVSQLCRGGGQLFNYQ